LAFCAERPTLIVEGKKDESMKTKTTTTGLLALAAALCLAFSAGCAPVTVTGAWRDAEYDRRISTAAVIGLFENPTLRRLLEEALVAELAKSGVKATASYRLLPGDRMPDAEALRKELRGLPVEAFLSTRLLNVERETRYIQPRMRLIPRRYPHRTFSGYYHYWYQTIYEPGYVLEVTTVSLETTLYDAATDRLIWSVNTESFNPASTESLVKPLTRLVVEQLKKDKLF
jgi:hypothetical protein